MVPAPTPMPSSQHQWTCICCTSSLPVSPIYQPHAWLMTQPAGISVSLHIQSSLAGAAAICIYFQDPNWNGLNPLLVWLFDLCICPGPLASLLWCCILRVHLSLHVQAAAGVQNITISSPPSVVPPDLGRSPLPSLDLQCPSVRTSPLEAH
jgi:hypothetical protein